MKEDSGDFIQKMLELGIGLSMVQQMPAMMKGVFPSNEPAMVNNNQKPIAASYYIVVDGKQAGPFSDDEMQKMVKANLVGEETLVWRQGMQAWKKATEVAEINKLLLMKNI